MCYCLTLDCLQTFLVRSRLLDWLTCSVSLVSQCDAIIVKQDTISEEIVEALDPFVSRMKIALSIPVCPFTSSNLTCKRLTFEQKQKLSQQGFLVEDFEMLTEAQARLKMLVALGSQRLSC